MDPLVEIAAALKTLACTTSPEYTYSLDELPSFNWASIAAIAVEDSDGKAIAAEWMGARWGRIEGDGCVSFCRPCAGIVLILAIFGDPDHAMVAIDDAVTAIELPEDELTG